MLEFLVGCGDLFGSINTAVMQQGFFQLIYGYIVFASGLCVFAMARRTFKA